MDEVEANSKKYEEISRKHNPNYQKILKSIPIIKQFIIDHNLIIYGGTAIDYALRLKGDFIYPDESLAIPDLDFYSYDNVKHAYDLADKLYYLGYKEVRAIRALYVNTMRVDLMDNTFIADFTYVPKNIFDTLPTLEYEELKIIHPNFQKIDLHRSLSFPYEYAPNEAIFARWKKDIARYNKLADKYPIKIKNKVSPKIKYITLPIKYINNIFAGLSAYAIIFRALKDLESAMTLKYGKILLDYSDIIPVDIKIENENIHLPIMEGSSRDFIEIIKVVESGKKVHPYMSILPKYYLYSEDNFNFKAYNTKDKLISINKSLINGVTFQHINVQSLLFMFLANAHIFPELESDFYSYYNSLLKMINNAELLFLELKKHTNDFEKLALYCPLFPSVETYGETNFSESNEILRRNIEVDQNKKEPYYLPVNYYPSRRVENGIPRPPPFVYKNSPFFLKDGLDSI